MLPPQIVAATGHAQLGAMLSPVPCSARCHAQPGAMLSSVPCSARCHAQPGAMLSSVPCSARCHAQPGAVLSLVPCSARCRTPTNCETCWLLRCHRQCTVKLLSMCVFVYRFVCQKGRHGGRLAWCFHVSIIFDNDRCSSVLAARSNWEKFVQCLFLYSQLAFRDFPVMILSFRNLFITVMKAGSKMIGRFVPRLRVV